MMLCAVLAAVGFQLGSHTYLDRHSEASFYQARFEPAVALACTGHLDGLSEVEAVVEFLSDPTSELESCDGVDAARISTWSSLDSSTVYLYALTAISWRLLGFNWSSLTLVAGLLTALFASAAYIFLRSFSSSRAVAFGLALAVLFSPPILEHIPHLRDFSKAPFIVLGLGLMGAVVTRPWGLRGALACAAALGVTIGLGAGFRSDVAMLAPLAMVVFLVLWRGAEDWQKRAMHPMLAIAVMSIGWIVGGAPVTIINALKPEFASSASHVFALGFADRFFEALGFVPVNFSALRDYRDEQVLGLVNIYTSGAGPINVWIGHGEYDEPATQTFHRMLATFPHDVFMRIFYVANDIGRLPINNLIYGPPLLGVVLISLLTVWRNGLFFVASAGFIIGVLTLQYALRHAFFMVCFGAGALGLAASLVIEGVVLGSGALSANRLIPLDGALRRALAVFGCLIVLFVAGWGISAATEEAQSETLVQRWRAYQQLSWRPIAIGRSDSTITIPRQSTSALMHAGLMAVEFEFPDPMLARDTIEDLRWAAPERAVLREDGAGFAYVTNGERGYQLRSRPIRLEELTPAEDLPERVLAVRIIGRTHGQGWTVGVLSEDRSRWLGALQLGPGSFDQRLQIRVPESEANVQIVWQYAYDRSSALSVETFILRRSASPDCSPRPWSIRTQHVRSQELRQGAPQTFPSASRGIFYLPFVYVPEWEFDSLLLSGSSADCIVRVSVANAPQPGFLPIELVEVDGEFQPQQRGDWSAVWSEFWRMHWSTSQ